MGAKRFSRKKAQKTQKERLIKSREAEEAEKGGERQKNKRMADGKEGIKLLV